MDLDELRAVRQNPCFGAKTRRVRPDSVPASGFRSGQRVSFRPAGFAPASGFCSGQRVLLRPAQRASFQPAGLVLTRRVSRHPTQRFVTPSALLFSSRTHECSRYPAVEPIKNGQLRVATCIYSMSRPYMHCSTVCMCGRDMLAPRTLLSRPLCLTSYSGLATRHAPPGGALQRPLLCGPAPPWQIKKELLDRMDKISAQVEDSVQVVLQASDYVTPHFICVKPVFKCGARRHIARAAVAGRLLRQRH